MYIYIYIYLSVSLSISLSLYMKNNIYIYIHIGFARGLRHVAPGPALAELGGRCAAPRARCEAAYYMLLCVVCNTIL